MPEPRAQSTKTYERLLDQVVANMGPRKGSAPPNWVRALPFREPGLANILNSFSCGSFSDSDQIQEWNPFSQRPMYEHESQFKNRLGADFKHVGNTAQRLLVLAHECMHVLLWEPFFGGNFVPKKDNFIPLSLAFEGFCFWHTDMVLNSKVSLRAPDGEKVFDRFSISQDHLHPKTAFEVLGLSDPKTILKIYVDAFRGIETELSRKSDHPLVWFLAQRIYSFSAFNKVGPAGMFRVFNEMGLFDRYRRDFCQVSGIPAILSADALKYPIAQDPEGYLWTIFAEEFDKINGLDREKIQRIRLRRAIQTRAYFALSLQHILSLGSVVADRGFSLMRSREEVNSHYNRLKEILARLANGEPVTVLTPAVTRADDAYSKGARTHFKRFNARTAAREQLYPEISPYTKLSLTDDRERLSAKALKEFGYGVLTRFVDKEIDFINSPRRTRELFGLAHQLSVAISRLDRPTLAKKKQLSNAISRLLGHDQVFKRWSLPLASVDPSNNFFREILFIYQ